MTLHKQSVIGKFLRIALLLAVAGAGMSCTAVPTAPAGVANTQPSPVASNPAGPDVLDGISVGFTEEGYPYRGSPDAPVTIQEFTDFLCPYCARHVSQTEPALLVQAVKTGQARFIFRDYPIAALHPTAPVGHQAARCVAEQGAALFWAMHDRLFSEQAQWQALADPNDYLAGAAEAAGADMTAYGACMASGRTTAAVDQGVADAQALGYNGTPTFRFTRAGTESAWTLEGAQPVDAFMQWITPLAAGGEPPVEPTPAPPELPFWAKPEGLAPDPGRPGFTMAGDPYKGSPDAVLTVVEFSDFQCPSCRKHALEVQPEVDRTFVDTGEIRWVFKNLPLKEHPQAPAAAVAAECAGEQGKFWEMYGALFASVVKWGVEDPDPALIVVADKLDLDADQFAACLQGRTALERVTADMYDAQGIVSTTPNFIALYGGIGTIYRGATSVETFQDTLQALLEAAQASDK